MHTGSAAVILLALTQTLLSGDINIYDTLAAQQIKVDR